MGFEDVDGVIKQMGDMLPPEDAALYRKTFEMPQVQKMVEARLADEWNMWVQAWLDAEVKKHTLSFEADTPIGDKTIKAPTKVDVSPLEGGQKVRLTMTSRLSGAEASRAIAELTMKYGAAKNAENRGAKIAGPKGVCRTHHGASNHDRGRT